MKNRELMPLTGNVLANLSLEELESRLEMQILALPVASAVAGDCTVHIGCETNICCKDGGCLGKQAA